MAQLKDTTVYGDLIATNMLKANQSVWSGDSAKTSESQIGTLSNIGSIYLYSGNSSNNRGIYSMNSNGTEKSIMTVDTSNRVVLYGSAYQLLQESCAGGTEVHIGSTITPSSATNSSLWINYTSGYGGTSEDTATELTHYYFSNRKGGYAKSIEAQNFCGNSYLARYSEIESKNNYYAKIEFYNDVSWMIDVTIRVYANYIWREYHISGYNYTSEAKGWNNPKVECYSSDTIGAHNVIFGRDANKVTGRDNYHLWVAIPLNSTLGGYYPSIAVFNLNNGYYDLTPNLTNISIVANSTIDNLPDAQKTVKSVYAAPGWKRGEAITGAVWNDYAEYRNSATTEPGYVVMEKGDDTLIKTEERLSHFAGITSDTWGFAQGETAQAKSPIAVAGRVLAYTYQDRNNYKPGDCVCAAPNGTVDIMTREEVINYPDRIVGTVSCVPDYDEWGGGDRAPVKVNERIWIKVK